MAWRVKWRSGSWLLPRHQHADIVPEFRMRAALADDAPAVKHDDAVRHRDQFVELGRNQQYADPRLTGLADRLVDRLHRADVKPARRLRREEEQEPLGCQFACQHSLLLVAARQAGKRGARS